MVDSNEIVQAKLEKLRLLEEKVKLQDGLPHLYGFPKYDWQLDYQHNRTNRVRLLCAANQIGKSSIQIIDRIHIATSPDLWPQLWPHMFKANPNAKPYSWYLYPASDVVMAEFLEKWIPNFLPRGEYKNHPVYGWKHVIKDRVLKRIDFNSGWTIYFKSYSQDVQDLQSGTVWAIDCFTKGHKVISERGLIDISEVVVGDNLYTRDGFKPVIRVFSREHDVITRVLSNGESLTGTPDHPFIVNDKVKTFAELTQMDQLGTVPVWRYLWLTVQTKRLCYLREFFIRGIQNMMTLGRVTITWQRINSCTLLFGNHTIKQKFLMAMLYIIKILLPQITESQTLSCLLEPNIQESTSLRNGSHKNIKTSHVLSVVPNLSQGHQKLRFLDIVRKSAVALKESLNARIATLYSWLDQMLVACTVQSPVPTKQMVYNVEVANKHEYYINGVLVHNCDEELPEHLYSELQARLFATNGYYSMVFTATLGQKMWHDAIEERGDKETFRTAWKRQVSMYDCLRYADGSQGPWTIERVKTSESMCKNADEIKRRIFGRFVKEKAEGLKYPTFDRNKHIVPFPTKPDGTVFTGVPSGWYVYSAVDVGSGGENHPAAYVFLSVSPDYKKIRAFKMRRLDGMQTTAGDVYREYCKDRGKIQPTTQSYDWASKEFSMIAERNSDHFEKAQKSHEYGEKALNTALKFGMIKFYESEESLKLADEFENATHEENKRHAKDDLIDAVRYAVMSIPIDWAEIMPDDIESSAEETGDNGERRGRDGTWLRENEQEIEDENINDPSGEVEYWNSLLD